MSQINGTCIQIAYKTERVRLQRTYKSKTIIFSNGFRLLSEILTTYI